jgi:primosomal protein N' (replication factor Y)
MVRQHLVTRSYTLEKVRVKPKMVPHLRLKKSVDESRRVLDSLGRRAGKQAEVMQYLLELTRLTALSEVKQKTGCSSQTIRSLVEKGLVEVEHRRVDRDPLPLDHINLSFPLPLSPAQAKVFQPVRDSLAGKRPGIRQAGSFFAARYYRQRQDRDLYTGAGSDCQTRVTGGIVLVPEIAMTPQIIERFTSRFPGRVAVLHSALSLGEQFDEWWRIKNGEFDVVIGPRSAIFAPQPDLGLIVIDEEHEWTYKQQDTPYYHTRDVAAKLDELTGAVLLLGSATPDVESYFRAVNGEYRLLELVERVTPDEGSPLPQVEIADLRAEMKAGNLSLFSRPLADSINSALNNHEHVLLFLNRRGTASFVECRDCGFVVRCKRCDVPMSYHFTEERLICHQCNYHIKDPEICPSCRSRRIKYLGAGTEKLEQEATRVFPGARILRWDSDSVRGRGQTHRQIFDRLKSGGADILIGTQMVAKGLDLPGITLVGVVSADVALNMPDFRANERTFQLLSQVAGRAGRGAAGGKVIIQTYSPEHYAIQSAAGHDYHPVLSEGNSLSPRFT